MKSRSRSKKTKLECPLPTFKSNSNYESGYYYVKRKSYKVSKNGKKYYVKSKCVKKRIPKKVCASCGYGDWGFLKRYKRKLKEKENELYKLKNSKRSFNHSKSKQKSRIDKIKRLENDIKELKRDIETEIKKSKNKKIQLGFTKIIDFNKKY
jgi:hypothetical protein